jgi:hypothetical protein
MLEALIKGDEVAAHAAATADAEAIAARIRHEAAVAQESLARTRDVLKSTEAARAEAVRQASETLAALASANVKASLLRQAAAPKPAFVRDPLTLSQNLAELASAKLHAARLRTESVRAAQASSRARAAADDLRDRLNALQNTVAINTAENNRTRAESKLEIVAAIRRAERAEATAAALSKRNQELSLQFMQHNRELTASTLNASSEVASLIDATQASKPWAIKAFLRRVFRRTQ